MSEMPAAPGRADGPMISSGAGGSVMGGPAPACQVRRLNVAYGASLVLEDIELDVPRGVIMALVGPNGAGKSTLIKAMLGLVPALTGSVSFLGRPLTQVRHQVAYMPQATMVDWDFPVTVRDVVTMGTYGRLGWFRRLGGVQRARVAEALELTDIAELADRPISALSGGQQRRVFLARALAQHPDVLLMDEPFAGIDAASQRAITSVLHRLQGAGRTILIVHHDLATVRRLSDHVCLLNRRIVASGPVEQAFTAESVARAYDVPAADLTLGGLL